MHGGVSLVAVHGSPDVTINVHASGHNLCALLSMHLSWDSAVGGRTPRGGHDVGRRELAVAPLAHLADPELSWELRVLVHDARGSVHKGRLAPRSGPQRPRAAASRSCSRWVEQECCDLQMRTRILPSSDLDLL